MKTKYFTWGVASLCICALAWVEMLLMLWLRYPCNHGDDFRKNLCLFLACGVLTVVPRQRCRVAVLVLSLLGVLAVLGLDYFNMALDYDTWIQRGMPPWGEVREKYNPLRGQERVGCMKVYLAGQLALSASTQMADQVSRRS